MTTDLLARNMYQEHILDLYRNPPHFGTMKDATHTRRSLNPLCGDDITISLRVKGGVIEDARFSGTGCALSIASAGLLTDEIIGKTTDQVEVLTKDTVLDLLGIPVGPVRLKCTLLPLEAIQLALGGHE